MRLLFLVYVTMKRLQLGFVLLIMTLFAVTMEKLTPMNANLVLQNVMEKSMKLLLKAIAKHQLRFCQLTQLRIVTLFVLRFMNLFAAAMEKHMETNAYWMRQNA